jgi:hypothetical protein
MTLTRKTTRPDARFASLAHLGFPLARISDTGNVQTLRKVGWVDRKPGRLNTGYLTVNLRKDGRTHYLLISRLVLLAFVGPCPEGMECCHNDGDHLNNSVDNLRWGTRRENVADSRKHGVFPHGVTNGQSKVTEEDVRAIRRLYATGTHTQHELASMYGLKSQYTISKIVRRLTWKELD